MSDSDDEEESLAFGEFDPRSVEPDVPEVGDDVFGTADSLSEADADPETARLFWRLVVVIDVALLALAVGPMLWYFEGKPMLGFQVFGIGVLAAAYGVYRYKTSDVGGGSDAVDSGESDTEDVQ